MAVSPKSLENLKKGTWQKGQSGNPKGRPKKLVNKINIQLKREGYKMIKNQDVEDAFKILLNLPLSKIQEILNKDNDEYPLLYKLAAKELISKSGGAMLERVLDRTFGKVKQPQSIEGDLTIIWKEEKTS